MTMPHPDEEALTGYLTLGPGTRENAEVEQHLEACESCLTAVMTIHRNLARGGDAGGHVPVTLLERASRTMVQRHRARPPLLLRYGVLIPASLAAGMLLAVGFESWQVPRRPRETRAVDVRRVAQVVAEEALVLKRPDARADVVARVERGDTVTVDERRGEWTRVLLAGGAGGWVASRALE
jgi:hypothetical protein